jgi:hypothetical protein
LTVDPAADDEMQPVKPSIFLRGFTLVGFFIACCVASYIVTATIVTFSETDSRYSLFAVCWGVIARLLLWGVRTGIKNNLEKWRSPEMLGEQLYGLRVVGWFVNIELVVSVALFVAGVG